jgi:hypothetical protein
VRGAGLCGAPGRVGWRARLASVDVSETATGIDGSPGDAPEEEPSAVLADLRRARRRRRTRDFDPFEALYRVYITAVVSGVVVWLLSGVTGDTRVAASTAAHVAAHDAQVIGVAIAVCWAVGLRSGGRGGPLVIEAADVRHVLLSPLDRAVALRPVAVRQLRFGGLIGAGVGAVAGLLAFRRLPGGFPAWAAIGAAVGALTVTSSLGLAMLVAGRRLGRWIGSGLAVAVVAWSVVDLVDKTTTSPATFLGQLALWPLKVRVSGLIGVAVSLAALVVGLATVPGSSLEAAERRATLVGQIRFAATLRDLRTVVVLRRQLAQELPRQRPWIQVPRTIPADWLVVPVARGPAGAPGGAAALLSAGGGAGPGAASRSGGGSGTSAGDAAAGRRTAAARTRRWPVWRRGWHGILRFPALRLARLAVLGAAAGAATVGVWRGTTPLIAVAGICLYVAGLDAVEPLAQEIDHPDRRESYAVVKGDLEIRQLAPSVVVMLFVTAFGLLAGYVLSGAATLALEIGAALLVPCALSGLAGAAISVVQGAPTAFSSTDSVLPPEAAGARAVFRIVWPPVVATIGLLPLLAGRHLKAGLGSPAGAVASLEPPVLIVLFLVGAWVRYREDIHAWFKRTMEEAKTAQKPPASSRR